MSAQHHECTWVPQGQIYSTEGRQPGPSIRYPQPAEGESRNRSCQAESRVSHLGLRTRHQRLDEKIKKESSSSSQHSQNLSPKGWVLAEVLHETLHAKQRVACLTCM